MNLPHLHSRSLDDANDLVSRIGADDLGRPTPCADWDLATLLAHMVGQHHGFAQALRTGDAPKDAYAPVRWTPRAWAESVDELRSAVTGVDPESAVVLVELRPTDPLPASVVVHAHLLDTAVHAWDVAAALGRTYRPDDDIVAAVAEISGMIPDGETRRAPGAPFGPAVPGDRTDEWDRVLAALGRDPDRR